MRNFKFTLPVDPSGCSVELKETDGRVVLRAPDKDMYQVTLVGRLPPTYAVIHGTEATLEREVEFGGYALSEYLAADNRLLTTAREVGRLARLPLRLGEVDCHVCRVQRGIK